MRVLGFICLFPWVLPLNIGALIYASSTSSTSPSRGRIVKITQKSHNTALNQNQSILFPRSKELDARRTISDDSLISPHSTESLLRGLGRRRPDAQGPRVHGRLHARVVDGLRDRLGLAEQRPAAAIGQREPGRGSMGVWWAWL